MEYIIKGHDNPDVDSIVSGYLVAKILSKLGHNAKFIIPGNIDEKVVNICNDFDLDVSSFVVTEMDPTANYVLVDHYEDPQLNVVAIIDHHLADKDMSDYWYEPASSTACMVAMQYEDYLDKHDIELACLSGFTDTASFHSTKARQIDLMWIKEMCQKYNLDYQKMYDVGLGLTDLSDLNKASLSDLKQYVIGNYKLSSSIIQVKDLADDQLNYMLELLKEYVKEFNLEIFAFVVHDMEHFKTKVYKISQNKIETMEYDKYTSRGNVIIPEIKKTLTNKGQ